MAFLQSIKCPWTTSENWNNELVILSWRFPSLRHNSWHQQSVYVTAWGNKLSIDPYTERNRLRIVFSLLRHWDPCPLCRVSHNHRGRSADFASFRAFSTALAEITARSQKKCKILISSTLSADVVHMCYEEISGEEKIAPVGRTVKARKKPLYRLRFRRDLGAF